MSTSTPLMGARVGECESSALFARGSVTGQSIWPGEMIRVASAAVRRSLPYRVTLTDMATLDLVEAGRVGG